MAGENSLVIQHYPDDFSLTVYPNAIAAPHDPTILLYADRDLYIDEIVVGVHAVGGTGAVLSFEVTRDLSTATAAGTVVALANIDTANIANGDTIVMTTDGVVRTNTSGVVQTTATGSTVINRDENKIPQGFWLIIDITGTISGGRASVQIRYRSRPK